MNQICTALRHSYNISSLFCLIQTIVMTHSRLHDVFLSYSRKDTDMMHRVRNALIEEGITVWTDEGIEPGTDLWQKAIEGAIENAGVLTVLLSPDAKQSLWVGREISHAQTHQVKIFSLLVRGNDKTSIPFGLAGSQYVDIKNDFSLFAKNIIPIITAHLNIESVSVIRAKLNKERAELQQLKNKLKEKEAEFDNSDDLYQALEQEIKNLNILLKQKEEENQQLIHEISIRSSTEHTFHKTENRNISLTEEQRINRLEQISLVLSHTLVWLPFVIIFWLNRNGYIPIYLSNPVLPLFNNLHIDIIIIIILMSYLVTIISSLILKYNKYYKGFSSFPLFVLGVLFILICLQIIYLSIEFSKENNSNVLILIIFSNVFYSISFILALLIEDFFSGFCGFIGAIFYPTIVAFDIANRQSGGLWGIMVAITAVFMSMVLISIIASSLGLLEDNKIE